MKLWKKGLLAAAFMGALVSSPFLTHMEVTADVDGQKDAFTYNLHRNAYADNLRGTPFVYSFDKDGKIDMFLDRNIDPKGQDLLARPWVHLPAGADNVSISNKLGPITTRTDKLSLEKPKDLGPG